MYHGVSCIVTKQRDALDSWSGTYTLGAHIFRGLGLAVDGPYLSEEIRFTDTQQKRLCTAFRLLWPGG